MRGKNWLTGLALGLAVCPPALSDDTEIYLNAGPNAAVDAPMVIFTMDYRANLTAVTGDKGCPTTGSGTPNADGVFEADDYPNCPQARFFANNGLVADLPAAGDKFFFFDTLRLALKLVLQQVDGVKVGIIFSHNHETNAEGPSHGSGAAGNNRKSNGAAVLMGLKPLPDLTPTDPARVEFFNKLTALKKLKELPNSPDQNFQGKELYFEMFRYLTGQDVYNGHNGWTDFEAGNDIARNTNMRCADNPGGNPDPLLDNACWDSTAENGAGTQYVTPLSNASQCTKIFAVNFMDQGSLQEADSDTAIAASKVSGGTGAARSTFNDMIQFMHDADLGDGSFGTAPNITGKQNVTSYFVVDNVNTTTNGYASAGGTQKALPLEGDPEKLVELLKSVFRQILSVSTTFVAASVPVNVFNRAEVIDNIYIALFQAQNRALWPGNLKKLKFKDIAQNDLTPIDTAGISAINPNDGRIKQEALTFWTNGGALPAPFDATELPGKDGRVVTRGGAGQKIPGFLSSGPGTLNTDGGARQLFTEPDSFTNGLPIDTLRELNADSSTVTALQGFFTPRPDLSNPQFEDVVLEYLKWLRGLDVRDIDNDNNETEPRFVTLVESTDPAATVRDIPWMLADTLHSRPVAVNYGARAGHTAANPDIRILMGTNDGFMHMFRNTSSGGGELGVEDWAFIPHKLLKISETLSESNIAHPYGLDGPAEVLLDDGGDGTVDGSDKVYAYFGLRRGGKAYYALDISNPDLPPKILWKIDETTPGFGALGLTFGKPTLGTMRFGASPTPVLIIPAGYDTNKDVRPGPGTNDSEGAAVYIVKALTGTLVRPALTDTGLVNSISSDIVAIDTDGDANFDRMYFGDTGGRIWRGDMPASSSDNTADWDLSLLADVGRHNIAGDDVHDRRFHHSFDVVQSIDNIGQFDAVIITSGDREDPKEITTTNYAFVIKDPNTVSGVVNASQAVNLRDDLPITFGELADVTDNCLQTNSCGVAPDLTRGFKLELETDGEKGLSEPITLNNIIFFTTYVPNTGAQVSPCAPVEGEGFLYAIGLSNGTAAYNFNTQDDDPSTPGQPTTKSDRIRKLTSGGIPSRVLPITPEAVMPPDFSEPLDPGSSGKLPIYWYQREDPARAN